MTAGKKIREKKQKKKKTADEEKRIRCGLHEKGEKQNLSTRKIKRIKARLKKEKQKEPPSSQVGRKKKKKKKKKTN